jgi:hypothetical protein
VCFVCFVVLQGLNGQTPEGSGPFPSLGDLVGLLPDGNDDSTFPCNNVDSCPLEKTIPGASKWEIKMERCDGHSRRDLLRVGGLTALGMGLGGFYRMQRATAEGAAPARGGAKAKACILVWLDGGPSHLETFDPKPNAPVEVRGPLDSISTTLPGVHLSECLPKTATMLHKLAVIRSVTSPLGEHNFGTHYLMTGYKPSPVLEYPSYGAVLAHVHSQPSVLPPHIAVPSFRVGGAKLTGGGYLPSPTRPFSIGADPAKRDFEVRDLDFYEGLDLARLDRRRQFVRALDDFSRGADKSGAVTDPDLERAYSLIASRKPSAHSICRTNLKRHVAATERNRSASVVS